MVDTYLELNPLEQMQNWLQNKYKKEYGSYKAVFSELVGGAHAANNYEANGFDHRFMFIKNAEFNAKQNKTYNILSESRILFTEIDHHFVNPISENYRTQLEDILGKNRADWVNDEVPGTESYPNGFSIFNEYMTWGLFTLYAHDFYDKVEVEKYCNRMEKQMINRGFTKFISFNQALYQKYTQNKNIPMEALTQYMIDWCSKI